MRNKNIQIMVETAVLVGAALLLSELRLFRAPQGGSVSLEMLPSLYWPSAVGEQRGYWAERYWACSNWC